MPNLNPIVLVQKIDLVGKKYHKNHKSKFLWHFICSLKIVNLMGPTIISNDTDNDAFQNNTETIILFAASV